MKLIGMLDSPYVRRVAICLKLLKLDFEHQSISVFSTYDAFAKINPVVKAPTLILDNGQSVMDSTVILQYVATLAAPDQRIFPSQPDYCLRAARLTGLALAACEKSVQIVYERNLRPADKQHEPWVDRVMGQLTAGLSALDLELPPSGWIGGELGVADITVACAFGFTHSLLADVVDTGRYPNLGAFSARAEALPAFRAAPAVDGAIASTIGG